MPTPEALREAMEEQHAMLQQAVQALASLTRTPQERLDRCMSYFGRTFRDEPTGEALAHWKRIYEILGNPPVGTPIACRLETLSADEQAALPIALCELAAVIAQTLGAAPAA